ncbi:hypothetical protein MX569_13235 [Anoxybacillus kestanbolensis]|uniref:Uncharacterized protein n=1 Tax=Anoxybacillus flavithermus NBRC 109594 TaxID=1315967 RepID=R4FZV5_9BACL|nr:MULTISPECIES: hypothetical protein [Anoxybacillus]MCL9971522.1 hypothetical protein [Anoxybacillus kestanbolensis]GAC90453.1 hypothetical protein KN10_0889 [Anoxybacillus flavithermus NBRC 109594]
MLGKRWEPKIQQFRQIKSHALSLLHFYAFEDQKMQPVHFQQLIPSLQRLIKSDFFEDFRNLMKDEDSRTEAQVLLEWLSSLGEVLKLSHGYYLPLPSRSVELPASKNLILLSSMKGTSDKYYGCGSGYIEDSNVFPTLTLDEWMPSLSVNEFIKTIKSEKPTQLTDEPTEVFLAKTKRKWRPFQTNLISQFDCYIARYNLKNSQPFYFWVEKGSYYKIPADYLDIAKYALEYRAGIKITVKCTKIHGELIHIRFSKRLPISEERMLMLFAFPFSFIKPIEWIMSLQHYSDFIWVLQRLGIDHTSILWEGAEV